MRLTELLQRYKPFDDEEAEALARLQHFLKVTQEGAFGRDVVGAASTSGHITATSWVLNPTLSQTLLVYHGKSGEWGPPGEHCDGEEDIETVSHRIAQQATGLKLTSLQDGIFDVNIRIVPEYWNTPEHRHYEVCFAQGGDGEIAEKKKVRWVSLEEAVQLSTDRWLARLVAKTRQLTKPA